MTEKESLSMTIRKATDNIEILMGGGKLVDEDDNIMVSPGIILVEDDGSEEVFTFEELSELTEYVEPMTDKEVAQAKEIEDLKAQLAAKPTMSGKTRKSKVKYNKSDEMKIAQDWKQEKIVGNKPKKKDFAKKYNISGNYLTSILTSFGVEPKRTNKTKANASIEEVQHA